MTQDIELSEEDKPMKDLNFKVSADFHKAFKMEAVKKEIYQKVLLQELFGLYNQMKALDEKMAPAEVSRRKLFKGVNLHSDADHDEVTH